METVDLRTQSDITRLEAERQQTVEKIERLQAELRSLAEPTADEADVDAFEREKTWALIQSLRFKLESIEHALHAARSGRYGICEGCGERIDPARLEIIPQATLCLKCQRQFEHRNRRSRRGF